MDETTAQVILYIFTAVEAAVWLSALVYLVRSPSAGRSGVTPNLDDVIAGDGLPANVVYGAAEVAGDAADLSKKAAAILAKESLGSLGQLKIEEQTDDTLRFERLALGATGQGPWSTLRRGQLHFTPAVAGRTRVEYALELSRGRGLLLAAFLVQIVGLIALITAALLMEAFVIDNAQPEVRYQVIQMVQVGHFLWPPFLLAFLYRRARRQASSWFEAMVNNLAYYAT
jgi:hypothetical protein